MSKVSRKVNGINNAGHTKQKSMVMYPSTIKDIHYDTIKPTPAIIQEMFLLKNIYDIQ